MIGFVNNVILHMTIMEHITKIHIQHANTCIHICIWYGFNCSRTIKNPTFSHSSQLSTSFQI